MKMKVQWDFPFCNENSHIHILNHKLKDLKICIWDWSGGSLGKRMLPWQIWCLCRLYMHTQYTYRHACKTFKHIKLKLNKHFKKASIPNRLFHYPYYCVTSYTS